MPSIARILAVLLLASSTALAGPIVGSRSDLVTCSIGNTVYTAKELQTMKKNDFSGFTDPQKTILRDCCAKSEATNSKGNDLNAATADGADRKLSLDPSLLSPSTASDPKNASPAFGNAKTDINQSSSPSSLFSDDKFLSSADTRGNDEKVAIKDPNNQPASFSTSTTSTASASENPETVGTDQRASALLSDSFSDPTISTASASKYPAADAKKVGAQSLPGSGKTDTPSSSLSPAVDDLSEAASAVAADSTSNRMDTGKSEQSLKGGKTSTSITTNENADPNNALNLAKAIESTSPAPTSDNVENAAKYDADLQTEAPATHEPTVSEPNTEAPNVAKGLADLLSSTQDDAKTDGQKARKGTQKPVEKQSAAQVTASESTTSDADVSGDAARFATSTENGAAADKKTANNSSFKEGSVPVTSGTDKLAASTNPTNDPATEVVNPLIEDVVDPKKGEVAKANSAPRKCSCPL